MAPTPKPGPPALQRWFQERPSDYPWEQDGLDHIHVLERSTGADGPTTADGVESARWRTGTPGDGEVALSGPRVLFGDGTVVVPWREDIRYTRRRAGYHGGVSLAEMTVPVLVRGADLRWWTWAGFRANATLAATLSDLTDGVQRFDDAVRLRGDLDRDGWRTATADAAGRLCLPEVDDDALAGLKFSEALPRRLAVATLAARLADLDHAAGALHEPVRFVR